MPGGGVGTRPKVKASPNRVKNNIIRSGLYKKKKTEKGKDFYSTRGFKIKDRKGDKTVTNKKGEKVVVRKSGNRVVTKADGTVVRRKANGDRVISKKPATPTKKTSGKFGRRPVFVNVGSAVDFGPFDAAHPPKSAATQAQVTKEYVRMPAEKANQGESRKDYILRKYNEGLAKGGTRGR